MILRRVGELFLVACVTASLLPLTGCSVVMFLEGTRRDTEEIDKHVSPEDLGSIDSGATIEVYLTRGSTSTGLFLGTCRESPEVYHERYEQWRSSAPEPESIPALGEELTIMKATESQPGVSGKLLGLDPGSILVLSSGGLDTMNLWMPSVSYVLDSKGNKVELAKIRMEMTEGTAPMMSSLRIGDGTRETRISLGDIDHVQVPAVRWRKWVGLGIGVAVDIALYLIIEEVEYIDWD